jgi:RNase P subunit RPR2
VAISLACPKCNSENTQKLTLAIKEDPKSLAGGPATFLLGNLAAPLVGFLFGVLVVVILGSMFGMTGGIVGVILTIIGIFYLRKLFMHMYKPKLDALPKAMKQNGYLCNRCGATFIPGQDSSELSHETLAMAQAAANATTTQPTRRAPQGFCAKCGTGLVPGSKFCVSCGMGV